MEWISVKDMLPELREDKVAYCYLVSNGRLIHMAYYTVDGWLFCECGQMDSPMYYGVTHWMPLPEPPKEE